MLVDRGSGVPIVLVPGIQGRWEWLSPTVDALAAHGRVLTFSFCDEPTSGFPFEPARGLENYLEQIDHALDRAGVASAVILGVSYGGLVAAEYAARRRDRSRGLVLASALPPSWSPDRRARFYMRAPRLLSPVFAVSAPTRLVPEIRAAFPRLPAQTKFAVTHTYRVVRAMMSPARMAARVRWLESHQFADLSRLDVPALVITGEDALDRVVRPELTREYLSLLRRVRHEVLPRTGHIGMVTRPREFASLVKHFIDGIGTDAERISA